MGYIDLNTVIAFIFAYILYYNSEISVNEKNWNNIGSLFNYLILVHFLLIIVALLFILFKYLYKSIIIKYHEKDSKSSRNNILKRKNQIQNIKKKANN